MRCLATGSCVVTQLTSGLIIGMLLFLVASGVTLIFGVLNVINFTHGSLYMLGAYFALTLYQASGSYSRWRRRRGAGASACSACLRAAVHQPGLRLERADAAAGLLRLDPDPRRPGQDHLGTEFLSMGMPADIPACRRYASCGGVVPAVLPVPDRRGDGDWRWRSGWSSSGRRFGKIVRAAAVNRPDGVGARHQHVNLYYAARVRHRQRCSPGLAGALAAPVRSLTPGMGFSILIESFIVTVIGGMGSIVGAFVAALLIGFTRSFGSIGFPLFTDGVMFLFMALVLIFKPSGLFGRRPTGRMRIDSGAGAISDWLASASSPCCSCRCSARSSAIRDFIMFAMAYGLLAMSLNLLIGYTGLVSFGHAMFFASGAYAFALAMQSGKFSIPAAFALAIVFTAVLALVIGAICVRLNEIYFAFLTLAFQMLIYNLILGWVSFTGGDQGLMGGIPRPKFLGIDLADRTQLYLFCSVLFVVCLPIMRQIVHLAVRLHAAPDPRQPGRAAFLGIDVTRAKLVCFVISACMAVGRRHAHGAVRVRRLSQLRLLDDLGRGDLHDHAGRLTCSWARWSAPSSCAC